MGEAVAFCVGASLFSFFSSWLGFRLNKTRSSDELDALSTTDREFGPGLTTDGWLQTIILYPGWLLAVGTVFAVAAVGGVLWISLG